MLHVDFCCETDIPPARHAGVGHSFILGVLPALGEPREINKLCGHLPVILKVTIRALCG
jgi:hypothetical protein